MRVIARVVVKFMTEKKNCHSQFSSHAGTLPLEEFSSQLELDLAKKTGLPLLDYFITQIFYSIKLRLLKFFDEVQLCSSSASSAAATAAVDDPPRSCSVEDKGEQKRQSVSRASSKACC